MNDDDANLLQRDYEAEEFEATAGDGDGAPEEPPLPTSPDDYGGVGAAAQADPAVAELPVVAASSLTGKAVEPRRWLIRDMIPRRTVTIFGGDGATGKSILAEQLAVSVETGKEWLGSAPERGPVVFVSAEDELNELHRRLLDIASAYEVDIADLADLHFVPLAGRDAVMGAPDAKGAVIAPTRIFDALIVLVRKIRPCLVILDTLADVFAGDEIRRTHARQFIGLLAGLAIDHDLAVVLIAHPSLSGLASGAGTSGSTAWSNSVRSRLYLETIKDEDGRELDADLRVLRVKKSNYGPAGLELRLRWSAGCFLLDAPTGAFGKIAAGAKAERVFLELLAAFEAQGRDVSAKRSNSFAPSLFARCPEAAGVRKDALEAAMERLLSAGRLRVETFGPPSKQRTRLVIVPKKDEEF
jgi:RecA-family ATPase